MNKQKLKEFMRDPIVAKAYKEGGILEVARLASMIGNLERDSELREIAEKLFSRGMEGLED
jgi:hypothetical protein